MARRRKRIMKGRPALPEGDFHVINRGARKVAVFADDRDRSLFLHLLGRFALKYQIMILTWCFMPNHFHLQLRATGVLMCKFMHDLQLTYAMAFNKRHGTFGCVFQGRYRCVAIKSAEGLAYVSRYIHANPRDLGTSPASYRWSSCSSYLGSARVPKWLYLEPVMAALRKPGKSDSLAYREYLAAVPPKKPKASVEPDEFADLEIEQIRRLEEKAIERRLLLPAEFGNVGIRALVCWSARWLHDIPAAALVRYYGYASEKSVHTIADRIKGRMEGLETSPLLGGDLWEC
jgi:REP-associated tyrosine transposase